MQKASFLSLFLYPFFVSSFTCHIRRNLTTFFTFSFYLGPLCLPPLVNITNLFYLFFLSSFFLIKELIFVQSHIFPHFRKASSFSSSFVVNNPCKISCSITSKYFPFSFLGLLFHLFLYFVHIWLPNLLIFKIYFFSTLFSLLYLSFSKFKPLFLSSCIKAHFNSHFFILSKLIS